MKRPSILIFSVSCIIMLAFQNETSGQVDQDSGGIETSFADTSLTRKSPMGALFRSVAFPGWGQFYNERYFKSLVIFGTETSFITLAAIEWRRRNDIKENSKIFPKITQTRAGNSNNSDFTKIEEICSYGSLRVSFL